MELHIKKLIIFKYPNIILQAAITAITAIAAHYTLYIRHTCKEMDKSNIQSCLTTLLLICSIEDL